jgi:hypothetical protein
MRKTTRIMISTFGAFTGLMGIEHGIGEVLQGRTAPEGIFILSWPDSEFMRILSGEPALTIIPDMQLTGLLAITFSLAFLIWAILFVHQRRSGWVMILLAVAMLLAGGGIFPPVFGLLIGAAATRLHAPLEGWRERLSPGLAQSLRDLWPWAFAACLFAWLGMFPGVPLLNYFFGVNDETLIFALLAGMFGFLFIAAIAGLARDMKMGETLAL